MQNLGLVILVFAFVFACIAALFMEKHGNLHFGWLAVACWIAAEVFAGAVKVFH